MFYDCVNVEQAADYHIGAQSENIDQQIIATLHG